MVAPAPPEPVRSATRQGRIVLAATVAGSGMAALDATVVNVALPRIGADLGAEMSGLQWVLNGYMLALAALILLGGALGDRYGRRRTFVIGTVWFAVASLACGLAPTLPALVGARLAQGVGAALLTPGSLAIIQATFHPDDRGRAVGAWSGLGGIATAVGPFVGGWLVGIDWRWVFLLNLPVAALVLVLARHVPETRDPTTGRHLDVPSAAVAAGGLGLVTWALIAAGEQGLGPAVAAAGAAGLAALVAFVALQARRADPLVPLSLFSSPTFRGANAVTLALYAALGGTFFLLVVQLQGSAGFSPTAAGAALLPVTVLMLALSSRAGALAQVIGPRLPMTVGPLVAAVGLALMARIGPGSAYLVDVLPAVAVFGLGLSCVVAPLTAAVLAAAPAGRASLASGINNAVARVGGLVAVAALPLVAGLEGADYLDPDALTAGFRVAILVAAALAALAGVLAWLTIPAHACEGRPPPPRRIHCAVDAAPLQPDPIDRPADPAAGRSATG